MEEIVPYILVDDDKTIVSYLKSIIGKVFPRAIVLTANNGLEAWEMIKKHGKKSIIISDIIMPEINGLQLLKNVRSDKIYENAYFILITGHQEHEQNLKALQQGADDFLYKPFSVDALVARLRSAARIVSLGQQVADKDAVITGLNEDLNKDAENMKELVMKFQDIRIPGALAILRRVAEASVWIAERMGAETKEEIKNIENSALLCFTGKLNLNDNLLKRPVMSKGRVNSEAMEQVPKNAKDLIASLRNFEDVSSILYHIYENFDGTGIPEKIKGLEIPLGSRVIRVALDYEEMINLPGNNQGKVLEYLYLENKRLFDFKVVAFYDQFLGAKSDAKTGGKETIVEIKELLPGMMISRNIMTESGSKILPTGTSLDNEKIEKLTSIAAADPIIGNIYIKERR